MKLKIFGKYYGSTGNSQYFRVGSSVLYSDKPTWFNSKEELENEVLKMGFQLQAEMVEQTVDKQRGLVQ